MLKSEIAAAYGISLKTWNKWATEHNEIGRCIGYFYNPKQVETIVQKIGAFVHPI